MIFDFFHWMKNVTCCFWKKYLSSCLLTIPSVLHLLIHHLSMTKANYTHIFFTRVMRLIWELIVWNQAIAGNRLRQNSLFSHMNFCCWSGHVFVHLSFGKSFYKQHACRTFDSVLIGFPLKMFKTFMNSLCNQSRIIAIVLHWICRTHRNWSCFQTQGSNSRMKWRNTWLQTIFVT